MDVKNKFDNNIFHLINKSSLCLLNSFDRLLIKHGFSIDSQEWLLLFHIIKYPGMNQKWYAGNILKDKTTTMRLVDSLEQHELIRRESDKKDRRQNLLFITESGMDMVERTIPIIEDALQSLFHSVSNEQLGHTMDVLKMIIDNSSSDVM